MYAQLSTKKVRICGFHLKCGIYSLLTIIGEQLYTLSEGTLSQDSNTKVGFDAVYGMASLTKLMTTIAIMICVERGQISLDDDVTPILPDLCALPVLDGVDSEGQCLIKPRTKTITLRLLMSHQSGCGYHSSPPLARWAKQNGKTNSVFDNDFVRLFPPILSRTPQLSMCI